MNDVDATTSFVLAGIAGAGIDLVVYDGGRTRLFKAKVESASPLRLMLSGECQQLMRAGRRVMILAQHEGLALRADGHLAEVRRSESGVVLEISEVYWEILERRRHVRVPVKADVSLRAVMESDDEPSVDTIRGTTIDLSVSGAFVSAATLPEEGTLIEFAIELDGKCVRTLAVVAHRTTERKGVGLHFVEYLDDARFLLHGFLSKAA